MASKKFTSLLALLCLGSFAHAEELDFYRDVYPFLKANCIACHNKTTTKADLNMETPELMLKGGESGPAIVPGKGADSLVVHASVHTKDLDMPPKNNKSGASDLTPQQIAILSRWIDEGAKSSVQVVSEMVWKPLSASVDPIYSVAMTKDGRYAACGRSNHISIYDLATRQLVSEVVDAKLQPASAHRALVQSLAFSPDGSRLASGSFREVKVWKRASGKAATPATPALQPLAPISDKLKGLLAASIKLPVVTHALSPNGKQIVIGSTDSIIRVCDSTTGKVSVELKGTLATSQKLSALDWSIAAQGLEQGFQKAEVARIEAQNKSLDELLKKANDAIVAMKKLLPEKQKLVKPAQEAKAAAQKAVDDAAVLVAKVPATKPDANLSKQLKAAQDKLFSLTMPETSALAAVAAVEGNIKDATEDVKRITDSKAKNAKDLATANTALVASKKIQDKATADLTAEKLALTKSTAKPVAVAFSTSAQKVAALFDNGTLSLWAVASGMPIELIQSKPQPNLTLTANADDTMSVRDAKGVIASTEPNSRWVVERVLGNEKSTTPFVDRVNALRFSPDGKTLATGGGESSRTGDIVLFDVATGKPSKTWKERHADAVLCLDYSPNGKLLASGSADKIARVTEIATGKQMNLFEGHTHYVTGVSFRADGRVLATSGADGLVVSWDMIMGERKKKIEGWTKEVTSLQFIGATPQILTSAGNNLVRIVTDEGTEVRAIANLPDFMQGAASTASGGTIIGGGEDSLLRIWDGTNGKELAAFGVK